MYCTSCKRLVSWACQYLAMKALCFWPGKVGPLKPNFAAVFTMLQEATYPPYQTGLDRSRKPTALLTTRPLCFPYNRVTQNDDLFNTLSHLPPATSLDLGVTSPLHKQDFSIKTIGLNRNRLPECGSGQGISFGLLCWRRQIDSGRPINSVP